MAEIASTYPTAGGLYYWSSKLGSPAWGWFTGWFNLIGLIGIIGAVGYGLAIYATAFFNLIWGYPNDIHHIFYLFVAFLAFALLVNVFDVRITSLINAISAYWHVIGVAIIVVACIFVPDHHQSASYVFTQTINNSGYSAATRWGVWPFALVFVIGSIGMAQYTLTGYDASAHMSEETHKASRSAAVGMIWAVIVSVIAGFILLVAITFAIPSQTGVQTQFTYITTYIWQTSMGTHWAEVLLFIVVCAQFFCLTACITSGSRMLFAFSRDRAVPGHQAGGAGSRATACRCWPPSAPATVGVPAPAPDLVEQPRRLLRRHLGGDDRALHRVHPAGDPAPPRRRSFERGAWSLGKHYKWINWIAILWVVFISIIFMLPTSPAGDPVEVGLHLERRQLRAADDRRSVHPLRRLVGALGQELVQGPGAHGHRRRARAARGEAGGRLRCFRPTRSSRSVRLVRGARRRPSRHTLADADPRRARREVEAGTIDTVVCAFTDMQGRLMGKREEAHFFLAETRRARARGLQLPARARHGDGPAARVRDGELGPRLRRLPPAARPRRRCGASRGSTGTALVLCDVAWEDGSPVVASPRQVLAAQVERARAAGFEPMVGSELEFYLLKESYAEAHAAALPRPDAVGALHPRLPRSSPRPTTRA